MIKQASWATWLFIISLAWLVLALGITQWDWQGRWHTTGHERSYWIKLYTYWAQYATLPLLIGALAWGHRRWLNVGGVFKAALVVFLSITFWAGQIEPHLLWVQHSTVVIKNSAAKPLRVALVSDIHLGLFVRDWQLQRLVNKINTLDVDAVLVAGDWTYEPKLDLRAGFAPMAQINKPVYAVVGNHDLQRPGPRLTRELIAALTANKVQLIEGKTIDVKGWQLSGLDDYWGGNPAAQARGMGVSKQRIVLTHQADAIALLANGASALTLAGHTHGGQVNVPIATAMVMRGTIQNNWGDGLYQTKHGQVFVTTGTGMVGLPVRLNMPPRIDVLTITGSQ